MSYTGNEPTMQHQNADASYYEDLVRNSNLDPMGAEFYPSNSSSRTQTSSFDDRAKQFNKQNGRGGNRQYGSSSNRQYGSNHNRQYGSGSNRQYGSGRTVNYSRSDYNSQERNYEHIQVAQQSSNSFSNNLENRYSRSESHVGENVKVVSSIEDQVTSNKRKSNAGNRQKNNQYGYRDTRRYNNSYNTDRRNDTFYRNETNGSDNKSGDNNRRDTVRVDHKEDTFDRAANAHCSKSYDSTVVHNFERPRIPVDVSNQNEQSKQGNIGQTKNKKYRTVREDFREYAHYDTSTGQGRRNTKDRSYNGERYDRSGYASDNRNMNYRDKPNDGAHTSSISDSDRRGENRELNIDQKSRSNIGNGRNRHFRDDANEDNHRNSSESLVASSSYFDPKRRGNYRDGGMSYSTYKSDNNTARTWRRNGGYKKNLPSSSATSKKLDAASQRERLEEMLNRRILECMVCCDKIKESDRVWSCALCFNILHLNCLKAWANSSKIENGWRCPACQNIYNEVPKQYKCYCGKVSDPKFQPGLVPHSCGGMCLREGKSCEHKCTLQCHPGPCPECHVMVARECGCGATKQTVKCNSGIQIVCESVCNKLLACQVHRCKLTCHPGECETCTEIITQECFCSKLSRQVPCRREHVGKKKYSCEEICNKPLTCGNHTCQKSCHEGPCNVCDNDVNITVTCPCGQTPLENKRSSCLDPVPCCGKICGKILSCGPPNNHHTCQVDCHVGKCPPCPLSSTVRCRCGQMNKVITCQELAIDSVVKCGKKCTKKRSCGKHKCNQYCCIEFDHVCPFLCNRMLSCGRHKCEHTCHPGRCLPCMEASFEELFCECGASVIYPPIPCGTKPPVCDRPCPRPRDCGHEVNHACHTGPCPPCTFLVKRWCYGKHQQRSAIHCHQENFSCGTPCGKDLACGRHKCIKLCHKGTCPMPCKQPCAVPRSLCGHPCAAPCHAPPCPDNDCKATVPVTCTCGLQKSTRPCLEVIEEYKNMRMAQLKEKMGVLSTEQTVDLSDIGNFKKPAVLKLLECTEECRVLERNRRLAIGLQIRNPDLGQKLMPRYSDFLKQWGKKEPAFCRRVHDKLTDLVELAKQSKQKSRSYSFESMNRDKRHVIHELAQHFGVETEAYDSEPNRNVVATAIKDKSWLPSMSLLQVMQRENGQRRVPGPINALPKLLASSESVSLKLSGHAQRPIGEIAETSVNHT